MIFKDINLDNVHVGDKYKTYDDLCEIIGESAMYKSNARTNQVKRIRRYIEYKYDFKNREYTITGIKDYTERCKSKNKFIEYDDYIIGYDCNSNMFIFDKSMFDIVSKYTWRMNSLGYIVTGVQVNGKSKFISMHRVIMGSKEDIDGLCIDHINHNRNDNRLCNLRAATQEQNTRNICFHRNIKSSYSPTKKFSTCKGVEWNTKIEKWIAFYTKNGDKIVIGEYDAYQDAKQARMNYEGEFSYDVSMSMESSDIAQIWENAREVHTCSPHI